MFGTDEEAHERYAIRCYFDDAETGEEREELVGVAYGLAWARRICKALTLLDGDADIEYRYRRIDIEQPEA